MSRTRALSALGAVVVAAAVVMLWLGGALGSSSASADATSRGLTTIDTPDGQASLQLGSISRESLEYVGQTPRASFFVGTDADNGFTCYLIARRDADATTASGCDPAQNVQEIGQFGYLEMGDGTAAVAYRSFAPIQSATTNGAAVDQVVKNVAFFEVPPASSVALVVRAGERTIRHTIKTGATLADSVGRGEPVR